MRARRPSAARPACRRPAPRDSAAPRRSGRVRVCEVAHRARSAPRPARRSRRRRRASKRVDEIAVTQRLDEARELRLVRSTWRDQPGQHADASPAPPATAASRAMPPASRATASTRTSVTTSSPRPSRRSTSVKRRSKPMLLHAAIERGARQAEFGGGERDVVAVLAQRLLDQPPLDAVEVEVRRCRRDHRLRRDRGALRASSAKSSGSSGASRARITARSTAWRSARTLPGQSCATSAARAPAVSSRHRAVVARGVEREEMVDQRRHVLAPLAQAAAASISTVLSRNSRSWRNMALVAQLVAASCWSRRSRGCRPGPACWRRPG